MSTPWGPGGSPEPYGERPPQQPYGREVQPYGGGGPVDPYAGQAAPPVPAYNPYVNPGSWEPAQYLPRQSVPGTIIAGSILGYLLALFLFVTGLGLVFFGSLTAGSFDEIDSSLGDGGTSLAIAGLGNWIAVALLVTGGVMTSVRRAAGLYVVLAGSGLVLVLAVYWVVLYPDSGIVFWAFLHTVLALLPAGLIVLPPGNRAWLAGKPGSGPPMRPPGPQPYPTDQWGRPFGS